MFLKLLRYQPKDRLAKGVNDTKAVHLSQAHIASPLGQGGDGRLYPLAKSTKF
ncbi:MAG: hypothetical protein OSB55_11990 [Verrucomicrobiota bacterium]|nr:hypothetical protein [Verrucomicrobiota bacterium]